MTVTGSRGAAITRAKRAAMSDLKVSLDSLAVLEQAMRHFYIKAMVEKSLGEKADWKAVDAAMVQAAVSSLSLHSLAKSTRLPGALTFSSGRPDWHWSVARACGSSAMAL